MICWRNEPLFVLLGISATSPGFTTYFAAQNAFLVELARVQPISPKMLVLIAGQAIKERGVLRGGFLVVAAEVVVGYVRVHPGRPRMRP